MRNLNVILILLFTVSVLMADNKAEKSILKSSNLIDEISIPMTEKAVNGVVNSMKVYVGTVSTDESIGNIVVGVNSTMTNSGYYKEMSTVLNTGFDDQINLSSKLYNNLYGKNFFFSDDSLIKMNQLKSISMLEFKASGDAFAQKVVQAVATNTGDRLAIINQIEEQFGKTLRNQAVTQIDTVIGSAYSEANVLLAEDAGITRFEYAGSLIATSRPFCSRHLGEIRTIENWDTFTNGQIEPVSIYLGGYNCRHRFVGVLDDLKTNNRSEISKNKKDVAQAKALTSGS